MRKVKCFFAVILLGGLFFLTGCNVAPPVVWISEEPHIVIFRNGVFNRSPYVSPFHNSRESTGYMIGDNGEKMYFIVYLWTDTVTFYDVNTYGLWDEYDRNYPPFKRGVRQNQGARRFTLDVDGEIFTFTRSVNYTPPENTFMWHPGFETLHGVWQTADGSLRLDLTYVTRELTDRRIYARSRHPRFHGVYNPDGANIGLLVNGRTWSAFSETFEISISENGNLRGHNFRLNEGGRYIRAEGTLDGDVIYLQINHRRFYVIEGDWCFPDEFTLHRVS